jgi:dipeptidyl aminopeptidase/acylaminoacyl peptidase
VNPSPKSGGVYLISAAGGEPTLLAPLLRAGSLAWSQDGQYIAVRSQTAEGSRVLSKVKGTGQLSVVTVATGEAVQVATGLAGGFWRPVWANPYTVAVILEGEAGQALAAVSRTGEAVSLLARGLEFKDLQWSRDGSALLASAVLPGGTLPLRVTLQDTGMDWTMAMDMTRQMKPDVVELLNDGAFQEWPRLQEWLLISSDAGSGATATSSGLRMARLAFDKYT